MSLRTVPDPNRLMDPLTGNEAITSSLSHFPVLEPETTRPQTRTTEAPLDDHEMGSVTGTKYDGSTTPEETPDAEDPPHATVSVEYEEDTGQSWKPQASYATIAKGRKDASDPEDSEGDDDSSFDEVPGPIKGFDLRKIFSNLNGQVQKDWEEQNPTAILVHYLDGGYGPGLAENVKVIKGDLRGMPYATECKGTPLTKYP